MTKLSKLIRDGYSIADVITPQALDQWQYWGPVTDQMLDNTPPEIKKEWGTRFGRMTSGIEMLMQQKGPLEVFDSICRLVTDGKIVIRCMLMQGPTQTTYVWRIEWAITPKGKAKAHHINFNALRVK